MLPLTAGPLLDEHSRAASRPAAVAVRRSRPAQMGRTGVSTGPGTICRRWRGGGSGTPVDDCPVDRRRKPHSSDCAASWTERSAASRTLIRRRGRRLGCTGRREWAAASSQQPEHRARRREHRGHGEADREWAGGLPGGVGAADQESGEGEQEHYGDIGGHGNPLCLVAPGRRGPARTCRFNKHACLIFFWPPVMLNSYTTSPGALPRP